MSETASPDFSKPNTIEVQEFKSYQTGSTWTKPEAIKAINVKPKKENYHVKVVRDVLYSLYPHSNGQGLWEYDAYMEKAVRKWQQDNNLEITGILTIDQLQMLGEQTGKFRLV